MKSPTNPKGAGRPKVNNIQYQRRINPLLVEQMDDYLKQLKNKFVS